MASTSSSTAVEEMEREHKRKRDAAEPSAVGAQPSKWRTRREHEIYSSKLLEALHLVRAGAPAPTAAAPRSRTVREAADRALAVAARGRSRWSRAILASRRRRAHRVRLPSPTPPPAAAAASPQPEGCSRSPALARKAKVLGRLVPGCRKLSFPALLAEASDYIPALEMQVRTMTAIVEALSTVSTTTSGVSSSPV